MTIHKEGYSSIALTISLLLGINLGVQSLYFEDAFIKNSFLFVSIVFLCLVIYFFRRPKFEIEEHAGDVLSPADGKVVAIEEVEDKEYFNDKRIQISVFMSPLNVHLNRYPISGKIKYFEHHNGHFHVAWHPKSSTENERTSTVVEHENGTEILFRQIAGAVARRIISYAEDAQTAEQGSECGFIKFGSRVDVLVPTDSKLNVKLGEKVKAGKTALASFNS